MEDLQGHNKGTGRCSSILFEQEGHVEMALVWMTFEVMACHSAGTFSVKQVICKVKWIHS